MSVGLQLVVALAVTVACLGGVVWSGITHRRDVHYRFIVAFLASLGVAIWRAEAYGEGLVFEGTSLTLHRIHMGAVAATALVLPAVVWTGVRLARPGGARAAGRGEPRPAHRRASTLFVLLILLTSALGTAMTLLATRT
jgi:hypothetical protein